jgi:ABC-2 type transport system permease protein
MAVYFLVCWSQFLIMLTIGVYIMPLLSLPALQTGSHAEALILMVTVTAFAAVGYGLMVGSMARTQQQASSFGSISVIIAAAIGGIWVPVFIMPEFMQTVSKLSPLNWALNGYQEVFLRGGAIRDVLPYALALTAFFLFTLMVPLLKFRLRNN